MIIEQLWECDTIFMSSHIGVVMRWESISTQTNWKHVAGEARDPVEYLRQAGSKAYLISSKSDLLWCELRLSYWNNFLEAKAIQICKNMYGGPRFGCSALYI